MLRFLRRAFWNGVSRLCNLMTFKDFRFFWKVKLFNFKYLILCSSLLQIKSYAQSHNKLWIFWKLFSEIGVTLPPTVSTSQFPGSGRRLKGDKGKPQAPKPVWAQGASFHQVLLHIFIKMHSFFMLVNFCLLYDF